MGDRKKNDGVLPICGNCKNFRPGKGTHGRCARKDKKREATDKACGHFDPKKA